PRPDIHSLRRCDFVERNRLRTTSRFVGGTELPEEAHHLCVIVWKRLRRKDEKGRLSAGDRLAEPRTAILSGQFRKRMKRLGEVALGHGPFDRMGVFGSDGQCGLKTPDGLSQVLCSI